MRLSDKIIRPIVTEKAVEHSKDNRYVFEVALKATKGAIALELKKLFDVDVLDVRTLILRSKKRRIGRTRIFSKTSKWKKAIVSVKKGQKIDFFPESE